MKLNILFLLLLSSIGTNIVLLTYPPNLDNLLLEIAEHAYFTGCQAGLQNPKTCHDLAREYKKDLSDHIGIGKMDSSE